MHYGIVRRVHRAPRSRRSPLDPRIHANRSIIVASAGNGIFPFFYV